MPSLSLARLAGAALAAALLAAPAAADAPNVAPLSAFDPLLNVLPAPVRTAILTPEQVTVANLPAPAGGANVAPAPVAVSAVPEPATWATMIAGFGLLGLALRGRRVRRRA